MQALPGCRPRDAGPGMLGREHRACTYSHKLGLIGFSRQQKEERGTESSTPFLYIRGSYSELLLRTMQGEMQVR